ncbi:hypothetical protein H257_18066 [Aphanomyces astaci]|uniref:Uncharacterized protein n=1 Tax=Aphanomyces astaci TaxID=112090 RepID=W4FCF3_APHAT|nr:hypothetical protein H257_18066 [Aphanomyces astaci]ETV65140.1 hypothetical protein H257_18066 [Aphanomyces astaci]|eukprot:XP_009845378.1 hypothetical protein H257_18066 [Aphanomyces astaci]
MGRWNIAAAMKWVWRWAVERSCELPHSRLRSTVHHRHHTARFDAHGHYPPPPPPPHHSTISPPSLHSWVCVADMCQDSGQPQGSTRSKRRIANYSSCTRRKERNICTAIEMHSSTTISNDAWDVLPSGYDNLRAFRVRLASVLANTTAVESDFSILKWELEEFRSCMMHLSPECTFQAKQRRLLMSLLH